ncbi:glutathione S-transferase family protein [Pseudomonas aeruginosa]|nr:glutathione S-transferase family protein [Pseudomonas aeruginosa]
MRRALEEKLPAHFDYLENHLGGRAFFVGERLTLADLAIASRCQPASRRRKPGRATLAGLAAHFARMLERPAMQALLPGERRTLDKLAAKA